MKCEKYNEAKKFFEIMRYNNKDLQIINKNNLKKEYVYG